jgi:hypothetical protein
MDRADKDRAQGEKEIKTKALRLSPGADQAIGEPGKGCEPRAVEPCIERVVDQERMTPDRQDRGEADQRGKGLPQCKVEAQQAKNDRQKRKSPEHGLV